MHFRNIKLSVEGEQYSVFSVGDEASEFELTVKIYSGDAGMIFYYQCCKQAFENCANLIQTRLG
jgi:hypothetical protein